MVVLIMRDDREEDLPFFMYVNVSPLTICGQDFRIHKFPNCRFPDFQNSQIPEFRIYDFLNP
jgi:hypothetical protein